MENTTKPQDFEHIKVTRPDDDEVIQAGYREGELPVRQVGENSGPIDGSDLTAGDSQEEDDGNDVEPAASGKRSLPSVPPSGQSAKRRTGERARHEGKLDDLDGSPMPLSQKIVIISAIILLIIALVYYFAVMR